MRPQRRPKRNQIETLSDGSGTSAWTGSSTLGVAVARILARMSALVSTSVRTHCTASRTALPTAIVTASATASLRPSARPSRVWSKRPICSSRLIRLRPLRVELVIVVMVVSFRENGLEVDCTCLVVMSCFLLIDADNFSGFLTHGIAWGLVRANLGLVDQQDRGPLWSRRIEPAERRRTGGEGVRQRRELRRG